MKTVFAAVLLLASAQFAPAQETPEHHAHVMQRGEQGMGFSQTATTHHFFLSPDGGVIQVEVNDPNDSTNRENIRMHLGHIAKAFAAGDFDIPMFVHDRAVPGTATMKALKKKIAYSYSDTANGARVIISSADKKAITAVHDFLVFQIKEHQTGDPMESKP